MPQAPITKIWYSKWKNVLQISNVRYGELHIILNGTAFVNQNFEVLNFIYLFDTGILKEKMN